METDKETIEKPKSVKFAVVLLWVSLLISFVSMAMDSRLSQALKAHMGVYMLLSIVVFLIVAVLIDKIGSGRNWARMLFIMLAAISAMVFLENVLFSGNMEFTNVQMAAGFVNNALGFFIAALLLSKNASPWFHQDRERTRSVSTDNKPTNSNSIDS